MNTLHRMKPIVLCAVVAMLAAFASASTWQVPYLSTDYVPVDISNFEGGYFYLEDFEDYTLNQPGVTMNGGIAFPAVGVDHTNSVDGDDGSLEDETESGKFWYSWDLIDTAVFKFDEDELGHLPNYAGIVWTDTFDQSCDVYIDFLDVNNNPIYSFNLEDIGDGLASSSDNDLLVAITSEVGIAEITVYVDGSTKFSLDHLQYGYSVPEPTSIVLLGIGGLFLKNRKK